ncbi:MAG: CopG family antitoxin [Litorilinea sp.]
MKEKERVKTAIPEFASREQEAEFWDTHDFGDYWEETEAVDVKFAKNLTENLTVRLSTSALALLRREANEKGVGPSTLARMWIVEHLRRTRAPANQQET